MESIWRNTLPFSPEFPILNGDLTCEAVVIGGGMAGILTAYELRRHGVDAVVIESDIPGRGVTGGTTAKITGQHGLIYHRLLTSLGKERAQQYARANQEAVEQYATIVEELQINCSFRKASAYVYDLKNSDTLRLEYEAATYLGLSARLVQELELPFPVAGAVRFDAQAEFHPLRFLNALLPSLKIYAHTTAKAVTDEGVETDRGLVRTKHIVVTTHFPFLNIPGFYFARMHQDKSYLLALHGPATLEGMYLDASDTGFSFRSWENTLLLGGGGHRAGKASGNNGYKVLELAASQWWPGADIVGQWSAQDCMPVDGIPYIGAYHYRSAALYVATGFQKWGMTTSMVAAHILSDLVTKRTNPNAEVFSPHRLPTCSSLPNLMRDSVVSAEHLLSQLFYIPHSRLKDIAPGHGGVVLWKNNKFGVYHSEDGTYYLVPSQCPHLGCQLTWNGVERTWECPCHGSRFDYQGRRLGAPATDDLICRSVNE